MAREAAPLHTPPQEQGGGSSALSCMLKAKEANLLQKKKGTTEGGCCVSTQKGTTHQLNGCRNHVRGQVEHCLSLPGSQNFRAAGRSGAAATVLFFLAITFVLVLQGPNAGQEVSNAQGCCAPSTRPGWVQWAAASTLQVARPLLPPSSRREFGGWVPSARGPPQRVPAP